ncbi:MAG: hypothetical protein GXO22_08410 [Aquificae bacterium]|nr:hypothetical protein [Aquificota bacterium]
MSKGLFFRLISFLVLPILIISFISSCSGGDSQTILPTDYEEQPAYTGNPVLLTQDSDGDGICDYVDLYPSDNTKSLPTISSEVEFNNNIVDATDLANGGTYPVVVVGSLAEGTNYYYDNDVFKITGKKGDRLSIVAFNGEINQNSSGLEITIPQDKIQFKLALLTNTGKKVAGLQIIDKTDIGISGIGVVLPYDGDFYLEISSEQIFSKNYNYPYVILIQEDKDLDGVSDLLEKVLNSNENLQDTDSDGISDFEEVYVFLGSDGGLFNKCTSTNSADVQWWDMDKDNIPNWYDVDSDGDGPPDRIEGASDNDFDFIPNFLDTDSNQDDIPDTKEAGESFQTPSDVDGDGIFDFADMDIDNDGIPNNIDANNEQQTISNYIFENGAIYISQAETVLENYVIKDIMIPGESLRIYALNLPDSLYVIFPIETGTIAVLPDNIDIQKGTLIVKVPNNVVDGYIYLYDNKNNKLSNGLYIEVKNKNVDPIIYPLERILTPGEYVTIEGLNLLSGDVTLIFTNGINTVSVIGRSNGTQIEFSVPYDAVSGLLYVQIGNKQSNKIPVVVNRNVNVSLQIPSSIDVSNDLLRIYTKGNEFTFDSSYSTQIPVENNFVEFITTSIEQDIDNDGNIDILPFYEGIVLPTDTYVVLDSKTTAVKWMFFILGYHLTQPPSQWGNIKSVIETTPEVDDLADYIDELLSNDISALYKFDDPTLHEKYKTALQAVINNVSNFLSTLELEPEIRPSDVQYDISLTPKGADIELANDTKLFLSVQAKTKTGTEIRKHISSPWDKNIVGPQWGGLLFLAKKTDIKTSGRDSEVEVITSGLIDPKQLVDAYRYVIFRTIFDGIVYPPLNDFVFQKLLGKKLGSDAIASIILELNKGRLDSFAELVSTLISNPSPDSIGKAVEDYILSPFKVAVDSCLQIPPGATCQQLAIGIARVAGINQDTIFNLLTKTIGKEIAARLTPAIGQIKLALDVLGAVNTVSGVLVTISDMMKTPGYVEFEVDFPLEITDVKPLCVSKNEYLLDKFALLIEGKGFTPYSEGILFFKKTIYPEVYLGNVKGKVFNVNQDGTLIHSIFNINDFSDGNYSVKVKHQGQEATFNEEIEILGENKIRITNLEPSKGQEGDVIKIYGCGFSYDPSLNEVYFSGENGEEIRGFVLRSSSGVLEVVVPNGVVTGDVYVKVKDAVSNSLLFTVEKANVTITFGDCGPVNDDTFALYIDGELEYSMSAPARPFDVNVSLSVGTHEVRLVGITAPDNIGTYCIYFSSNVRIISGPPTSGTDLTAGVTKIWVIEVVGDTNSQSLQSTDRFVFPIMKE